MQDWQHELFERLENEELLGAPMAQQGQAPETPVHLSGLDPCAKRLASLAMYAKQRAQDPRLGPLVYVVEDGLKARSVIEQFQALTSMDLALFPSYSARFSAGGVVSRETEIEQLSLLELFFRKSPALMVVPANALYESLPSAKEYKARSEKIVIGQHWEREALCASFERLGYERSRQAECAGQYAVRGDLVDVVLRDMGETKAYRIDFFDEEVDDLRRFDLDSQRAIGSETVLIVPPVKRYLLSPEEEEALAAAIRQAGDRAKETALRQGQEPQQIEALAKMVQADAEALETGKQPAGMERWDFLLPGRRENLLDYLRFSRAYLVLDEPKRLRHALDQAQASFQSELKALLLQGRLVPESIAERKNSAMYFKELCAQRPLLSLVLLATADNGLPWAKSFSCLSHEAERFQGKEAALIDAIRHREGWTVVMAVGLERRLKRMEAWKEEEGLSFHLMASDLGEGCLWPAAKFMLLGNVNLFGHEKRRIRKAKDRKVLDFFSDLQPGELVVHDLHGIARYLGIKTLVTEGVKRDYLFLAYDGEDRLYIPVERLDELCKYVAGDQEKTKLSKLGSMSWERQKKRARQAIKKLATNLVGLYAQRRKLEGHVFSEDSLWQQAFEEAFPYEETEDQLQAMDEIKQDMQSAKVMDRLLCGDVGFGKTELAFRALFKAVSDGKQGAMLVPTTVLAGQHYQALKERLGEMPVRVALLSRFVPKAAQQKILKQLANGQLDIVIGTHRLLSKDLRMARPGLLVIDEEQRFGVDHKERLKERYPRLDVLSLSATPIPRTLHMSMSGIRDISVLQVGPEARWPVETYVLEYDEGLIDEAIRRELSRGGQVFYLFNDTRKIEAKALELEQRLPGARLVIAHGQMAERRLEEAVQDFVRRDYDILLCTTIIESGIDMPNVNTLIVEHANRLGLAQLYQLRGRVGRSARRAYAYVTYQPEKVLSEEAEKRLAAIRDYTELGSGFRVALRDLEVRGAGSLLGGEQSGHMERIGYEMYCRMLDEEIKGLQGGLPVKEATPTVLDLQLDAMIPPEYIADEGQRMDLYRRVIAIQDSRDWLDVYDELLDRFGEPPAPVLNLIDLGLTRARATQLGMKRIRANGQDLFFEFGKAIKMEALGPLFQQEAAGESLLFNAGAAPFLLLKGGAAASKDLGKRLRHLFFVPVNSEGQAVAKSKA